MKQYLALFNPLDFTPQDAVYVVDSLDGVANWLRFFDNVVCFLSDRDAHHLTSQINILAPNRQFLVVELSGANKNGMLVQQVWDFINQNTALISSSRAGD